MHLMAQSFPSIAWPWSLCVFTTVKNSVDSPDKCTYPSTHHHYLSVRSFATCSLQCPIIHLLAAAVCRGEASVLVMRPNMLPYTLLSCRKGAIVHPMGRSLVVQRHSWRTSLRSDNSSSKAGVSLPLQLAETMNLHLSLPLGAAGAPTSAAQEGSFRLLVQAVEDNKNL